LYICTGKRGQQSPLFSYRQMKNPELLKEKIEEEVIRIIAQDPDHFFVDSKLSGKKLQVFVDSDSGIAINKCAEISRALEKVLDAEKWLGEDYVLEVSSPGMDTPLKVMRQFKRRTGREVEVLMTNGIKHEGKLMGADANLLKLEITKKVSKKETVIENLELPFSEIKYTKLKLNF
jgi:ribosome maturation factor RimP